MALVYSCCFWFSLRLGGILIGLFSLVSFSFLCPLIQVVQQSMRFTMNLVSSAHIAYLGTYLHTYIHDTDLWSIYGSKK